jgi:hypothetical protein
VRTIVRGSTTAQNGRVELIRASAERTYNEGDEITGLIGKGTYEGQELKIVVGEGFTRGGTTVVVELSLFDSNGTLIDSDQFQTGDDESVFVDENDDEVLRSGIYIQEINKRIDEGFQEVFKPSILVGDNRIELNEGRGFPFDQDDTDGIYDFDVDLVFSSETDPTPAATTFSDNNTLKKIVIFNEALTFDNDDSYLRSTGRAGGPFSALNPNNGFENITLKTDTGDPFIQVEYGGFETEVYRYLRIGRGVSESTGHVEYTDVADVYHKIPLEILNLETSTNFGAGRIFSFDEGAQDYYYEALTTDVNVAIPTSYVFHGSGPGNGRSQGASTTMTLGSTALENGQRLNGIPLWDVNANVTSAGADGNVTITSPLQVINGGYVPTNCTEKIVGDTCIVNGIRYTVGDAFLTATHPSLSIDTNYVVLTSPTSFTIVEGTAVSGTLVPEPLKEGQYRDCGDVIDGCGTTFGLGAAIGFGPATQNGLGSVPTTAQMVRGRLFLDDGNVSPVPFRLEGLDDRQFDYSPVIVDTGGRTDVFLTLFKQTQFTQDGGSWRFLGTDATYTGSAVLFPYVGGTGEDVAKTAGTSTVTSLDLNWYAIDDSDYGLFSFDETDPNFLTAVFQVGEGEDGTADTTYELTVYVDTENDRLVDAGDDEITQPKFEAQYDVPGYNGITNEDFRLRSDRQETYMSRAFTDFGSKVEVDGSQFTMNYPEKRPESIVYVIGKGDVQTVVTGGQSYTVGEGKTITTETGDTITIDAVNFGNATCVGRAAETEVACTATPSKVNAVAPVPNPIVYLDTSAPVGTNIIVGGPIVNQLAADISGLANKLSSPGDRVAEVDATSGDIVVAGYTANDTGRAAQELIDSIDALGYGAAK